jgi:GT2 family glycosyltransferase
MKTSIILVTHNGLPYTQACIESIHNHTLPCKYEIIAVDNASSDGTVEWLERHVDVHLIRNSENKGFPAGCNQGLAAASGDYLLLLNNDTIVTPRWLTQLLACLDSDHRIGAVGPVTNNASYYTAVAAPYQSLEEMAKFAESHNDTEPSKWTERLKLIGFCLLMKREVYEVVGDLDERFTPGNFEDDDYCLRIRQAGYRLMLCGDTFIHHEGSGTFGKDANAFSQLLQTNSVKFAKKWGFDPLYSFNIRYDILSWLEESPNRPLKVLEVGCACGATLLEIRNQYPLAQVYGLELNPHAAAIASLVSEVQTGNIEWANLDFPNMSFDYIIFGDVLEHLQEPWNVLSRMHSLLKPGGKLLASIPNVSHFSVIRDLIQGRWTYTDRGLLDITHLRFFTLESLQRLFNGCGFPETEFKMVTVNPTPEEQEWIDRMADLFGPEMKRNWMAYQYLIRAGKPPLAPNAARHAAYQSFKRALRRLEWDIESEKSGKEAAAMWRKGDVGMKDAARFLMSDAVDPDAAAQKLAQLLKQDGLIDSIEGFVSDLAADIRANWGNVHESP